MAIRTAIDDYLATVSDDRWVETRIAEIEE
jgi:hypothetical protein